MNEHATKVLDAYLDADKLSVPHAILIEGRWGSGKTYFLQKVYEPGRIKRMQAESRPHIPFLFVSLFGATSARDVEMRIYKTACPGEAVAGGIAGTIAIGIGEILRVKDTAKTVVEKFGENAIRRLSEYIFVFDDLERVEKDAFGEVMGLVNSFVAEHGRRVLLVTDEDKLKELVGGEIWKDQNEKIVGRRARIEADLESVVQASVRELPDGPAKAFMTDRVNDLLEVARASEVENLRNLSWAMHNATAFVDCLIIDDEIPGSHVAWTMAVVLATTLWMRSGLLDTETLKRLPGLSTTLAFRSVGRGNPEVPLDPQLTKAKAFSDAFGSLSVDAPPVDYGFVNGFEKSGVLDRAAVNTWIKSQFGFGREYTEASWRKLWYSRERPIAETEQAVADLKDELARRVYTKRGPILHAAGLALRQSAVNDRRLTDNEDVVTFFKRYIDELADQRLLERSKIGHFPSDFDGYGGLGFSSQDTDEFQEILRHIRTRSEEVAAAELRAQAEVVLDEAEAGDLEALFKLVRSDNYELSTNPVLMDIPVDRLAALMAQDAPALNAGAKMLAYRYHSARNGDPLLQEIRWARAVYAAVVKKLEQWEEPHRTMALESLRGLIRHYEQGKQPDDMIIPPEKAVEAEE
ncbi:MAG: KAP family NTPase [Rhizobiaceae bacterium]|nr:KAP family NTPase [Rhizobiaceae bacterium]MCV0408153.1 KAP family NTPase [Rhizobiaceae bacterium]